MEPMTLGSAPSSPSSPGIHHNFLPNFLMGDTAQPSTPNYNLNTSPGRNRTSQPASFRKLTADQIDSNRQMYNIVETPKQQQQQQYTPKQQQFTPHKPGPPSQSLFDTIDNKKPISPVFNSTCLPFIADSPGFGRNISRINEDSLSQSKHLNDTINRSANVSRMDRIDTHWVTVFGFPPSALSLVLAQLANCGVIVEKKIPTQGNWLHVKFNNLSDVPRALALNGRCINNSIMIGVCLFYNKENKENDNIYTSPIRARSLRQSFVSPSLNNSVMTPQNLPQRSTGIVSKAIEYVFGW